MQKIRGKSNVDHYISTLRAEATFWPCKLACYFPLASSTAAQPIRRRIETYQKVETTCCLHAAFVLAPEIQPETVLNQGRSQDFFRGTHNSPNSFPPPRPPPPPPKKKDSLIKDLVVFSAYEIILATCMILLVSRVWIHQTIRLHNFSDSKGIRIILLLGSFCRF